MKTGFTTAQIQAAHGVYVQDVCDAKARGAKVDSMGATMRAATNKGRVPRNTDEEFNRLHAERSSF